MAYVSFYPQDDIDIDGRSDSTLTPATNKAFLDKTIDWPSPAETESWGAIRLWRPIFEAPSPTVSSSCTPRPLAIYPSPIASRIGPGLVGNLFLADVRNGQAILPEKPSSSLTIEQSLLLQASVDQPVNPLSLEEMALSSIKECIDRHANFVDANMLPDIQNYHGMCYLLADCAQLLGQGFRVEAIQRYDTVLAKITASLKGSGELFLMGWLILVAFGNPTSRERILFDSVLQFLSQTATLDPKPSSQALASLLLLDVKHDNPEMCLRLYQCLVDHLSQRTGNSSAVVIYFKACMADCIHVRPNHASLAVRIASDLKTRLDLFAQSWTRPQSFVFSRLAIMLFDYKDYSTAAWCFDLALTRTVGLTTNVWKHSYRTLKTAAQCYVIMEQRGRMPGQADAILSHLLSEFRPL